MATVIVDGFQIGGEKLPSQFALRSLLSILNSRFKPENSGRCLTRNAVTSEVLPELGQVAVKRYLRGGIIGNFINSLYLRSSKTRSQLEFERLRQVREKGVKVPEPLLYVSKGALFYRAWLVTRKIENSRTLADISLENEDALHEPMEKLVKQVELLIRLGIFHIDLHPGNVLVRDDGEVYLVDFDKSLDTVTDLNELRNGYIFRWRRAVIKHRLPQYLCETFCLGLKSISLTNGI